MFASDSDSERATSIEDYQYTCSEFINDISKDYKDWVDRYQLSEAETKNRKDRIDLIVKSTNDWISRYGTTIKKIDIIMNDGINKMAETTAGYPFQIDITSANQSRYIIHGRNPIKLNLKSYPRQNRQVRLSNYDKDNVFLLGASNTVEINYSNKSFEASDLLDEFIVLKPVDFNSEETISITVKIEELEDNTVMESRGYTTLIVTK
ncbi:MAG TPA: hypothetical protein VD815_09810 [Candidatus Saccharimonadales bacterium]|nr:hypothetical protein [Candidatus Saccharimonadales bacterium]